jgi:hypothetical protein
MSRGSNSHYVIKLTNRLRDKLTDLRLQGIITIEMESIFYSAFSIIKETLDLKCPDKIMTIEEIRDKYTKEIDQILYGAPFNLKEFTETLNVFIGYTLLKIEDKRSEIRKIKKENKLINQALLRISIYLNECSAALLVTNDFLNSLLECEDQSELEYLLMSFSDQEK